MKATQKGIEINREELWALLEFTGDSEEHSAVHFRVNGSAKLEVAATNGKRSVECIAKADKAEPIEIAIDSDYLEKCRVALDKGQSLLIEVGAKGVKNVAVIDTKSGDKIIPVLSWHRDAASTQLTLTSIAKELKLPKDANWMGSWVAFDPVALNPLDRIKVATNGCPITLWPPKDPGSALQFEARSESGHWKASILPERVIAPGDEREKEDEDDAPGRNDRQARLDLADRAKSKPKAENGEDADAPPKLATEKPKRERRVKPSQMKAPAE
jgi:hypothetical protein